MTKTLKQLLQEKEEFGQNHIWTPASLNYQPLIYSIKEWLTQKRQSYELPKGISPSYDVIIILSVFDELLAELNNTEEKP